jgi:hypothetical protein
LHLFAQGYPEQYGECQTVEAIQQELDRLETAGMVEKPGLFPGTTLYYFTDTGPTPTPSSC